MASNSFPNLSFSSSSSESEVSRFEASIEQLRGTPVHRPHFLRPISPVHEEEDEYFEPPAGIREDFDIPLEERRRIPGCGINHHDIFDESVGAETAPIYPKPANFDHSSVEDLFDQFEHDHSPSALVGCGAFIKSHFQQRQYLPPQRHLPRYNMAPPEHLTLSSSISRLISRSGNQDQPNSSASDVRPRLLSPISTSSFSSDEDESVSGDLRRIHVSAVMSTPKRRIISHQPLRQHTLNSMSQQSDYYTPENSPSPTFDSFRPLHTSTFTSQSGSAVSSSELNSYNFRYSSQRENTSSSRDESVYHTPSNPAQLGATYSINHPPRDRSQASSSNPSH
ncbi:unnamed protein product [Orchesella dallaii]|uniref:Uncharacterized protein n=1 Tax=Orchesella dallaii TaxID=48710 RepID=A0ABP1QA80_9HEXA